MSDEKYNDSRALLLKKKHGVLSTISVAVPGYPFGSVTPYCLDYSGSPIILISDIAQHTKNILVDPKVSLTVIEEEKEDVQAEGRLTYLANAQKIETVEEEIASRYYRYFPASQNYHKTHNFFFFRLEFVRARHISGFGKIYWLDDKEGFLSPNPFSPQEEDSILQHMNEDHQEALRHYLHKYKQTDPDQKEKLTMVGIDEEGFDVFSEQKKYRFSFEEKIHSTMEAREALVAMAKR